MPSNDRESDLLRHVDRLQLSKHHLGHVTLTQPVGADQSIDRLAVLREPASVLERRRGRPNVIHRDPAPQRLQERRDIGFGSRIEQFGQCIVTQILDLVADQLCDVRDQIRQSLAQSRRDVGRIGRDIDTPRCRRRRLQCHLNLRCYAEARSPVRSSAMSTSMSSCPPTRPWRPASSRSVRASTSKRSPIASA